MSTLTGTVGTTIEEGGAGTKIGTCRSRKLCWARAEHNNAACIRRARNVARTLACTPPRTRGDIAELATPAPINRIEPHLGPEGMKGRPRILHPIVTAILDIRRPSKELAVELVASTFGHTGNLERWCDHRTWAIFLLLPWRRCHAVKVGKTVSRRGRSLSRTNSKRPSRAGNAADRSASTSGVRLSSWQCPVPGCRELRRFSTYSGA